MPGSSTEGNALPASQRMGSEYDLFDITSAMDWYEGDGGLLDGGVQARVPEGAFQQDLLHGLETFSREQQQPPVVPAWGSQAFSNSFEISRQSGASTMIPTDSTVGGAHPAGDPGKDVAALRDAQCNLFQHSLIRAFCPSRLPVAAFYACIVPPCSFAETVVSAISCSLACHTPMVAQIMTIPSHMPQILDCSCQAFLLTCCVFAQAVTTRC